MSAIVIVVVVVVLLAVFGLLLLKRRSRRNCIVLYGPGLSGKTALFFRLKTGKFVSTVASMKENEGTFVWEEHEDKTPRHTVDIPGHGRLRWRLKDFLPIAESIVVVLDSTGFTFFVLFYFVFFFLLQKIVVGNKDYCTEAANMVWDAIHVGPGPRIIVACNKTDDLLALSTKRIKVLPRSTPTFLFVFPRCFSQLFVFLKALLETQMTALARTRSKYPAFHDGENADTPNEETIATAGSAFTFEISSPIPVEFVAISVKRGGKDLQPLFEALKK